MRKSAILILGLLLTGISSQAQNIFVRVGLGCAVSTAADFSSEYTYITSGSNKLTTKRTGLGTGVPVVVAAGYKISRYFAIEMGIDYLYGFKSVVENNYQLYTTEYKTRGSMLSIVPAAIITFPMEKIQPYARLGLKVGLLNSKTEKYHRTPSPMGQEIASNSKDYGGVAIGVQAAMGTEYSLNHFMSLFGEIQVDGISYSPQHGKYTEYASGGVDILGSMTVKEKEWDYVKEYNTVNSIPGTRPDQVESVNHQFGNVGLLLGIKFYFN
jgi:hypothetical protein